MKFIRDDIDQAMCTISGGETDRSCETRPLLRECPEVMDGRSKRTSSESRYRAPCPKSLLPIAIVVLILQLIPNLGIQLLGLFDLRTWTPHTWFSAFANLFKFLCLIRFGPEVTDRFREQISRRVKDRARRNLLRLAAKQLSEQEER